MPNTTPTSDLPGNSNIYSRIHAASDRAATVSARMGHPLRRNVVIRTLGISDSLQPVFSDLLIAPPPLVTSVPIRMVDLQVGNSDSALTVASNDLLMTVGRSLPRNLLVRDDAARVMLWVDVALDAEGAIAYSNPAGGVFTSGVEHRLIHIDDADCCVWKVILRRVYDR